MEKLKRILGIFFIYSGSVGILTALFTGVRVLFSGAIGSVTDLIATLAVVLIMASIKFYFIYLGFRLRGENLFELMKTGGSGSKTEIEADEHNSGDVEEAVIQTSLNDKNDAPCKDAEMLPVFSLEEALARGRVVMETARNETRYGELKFADADSSSPLKLILVEERFISGHDDSAGFVDLVNEENRIVSSWMFDFPMKARFREPDTYDDDCLVLLLKEEYGLPVEQYGWSAYHPKNREVGNGR
ncbi:MAG: hypothetical protein Q4B15_04365 [Lachnospiraceae bacterium]|nr:hypothetical protein [Lachnospiraceae bacterium]